MKNTIACLLLISLTHLASAQTYFSFSEKIINADFSAFRPLEKRGYSALDKGVFQLQPGIKVITNKWTYTSHFSYFVSNDQNRRENKSAEFHGYGFAIGAQYHLLDWKSFKLQPTLEIGARKYYLDYFINPSRTFPSTITKKINAFSFIGQGIYSDIGVILEKRYEISRRTFGIGFGAGYRLDYGTWQLTDPIPIQNAKSNHNGMFLNINIVISLKRGRLQK